MLIACTGGDINAWNEAMSFFGYFLPLATESVQLIQRISVERKTHQCHT
jgi:hypothetical protein